MVSFVLILKCNTIIAWPTQSFTLNYYHHFNCNSVILWIDTKIALSGPDPEWHSTMPHPLCPEQVKFYRHALLHVGQWLLAVLRCIKLSLSPSIINMAFEIIRHKHSILADNILILIIVFYVWKTDIFRKKYTYLTYSRDSGQKRCILVAVLLAHELRFMAA